MTKYLRSQGGCPAMCRFAAALAFMTALVGFAGCTKDADDLAPAPAGNSQNSAPGVNEAEQDPGGGPHNVESNNQAHDPATEDGSSSSTPSDLDASPENGAAQHPIDDGNGGQTQPGQAQPAQGQPGQKQPGAQQPAASAIPQPPPPAQVYKPEVILSQYHAQTCVIGVGDQFPAATLPDLEGNSRELSQLYGDRMTIVVFWNAKGFQAREQFTRIMHECQERYGKLGVSVVAINVGDSPEVVRELAAKHRVTIPCLLDADGQAFAQAATDLLPRTYLLDAAGKVVWFDLEYSRSQRLELHNAVYYQLKQNGA